MRACAPAIVAPHAHLLVIDVQVDKWFLFKVVQVFAGLLESLHVIVGEWERAEADQRLPGDADGDMFYAFHRQPADIGFITILLRAHIRCQLLVDGALVDADK